MKVDKKAVGKKIKEFRLEKGLTLEAFGAVFQAGKTNVRSWETGNQLPNKARLAKLAKFMGISVAELLATQPKETRIGYISSNWQPTEDYISWVMGN